MNPIQKDGSEISDPSPADRMQQDSEKSDLAGVEIADPVTLSGILADLLIHAPKRDGRSWMYYVLQVILTAMLSSGFHMTLVYRVGAFLHRLGLRPLSILAEKFIYHWYHCVIPCSARIGPGLWIPHPLGIVLNSRTRLGAGVWLRQFTEIVHVWSENKDRSGVVGDRVELNSGAILLRGAVVGHDSIVAARAVVTKFIPPRHIAKGIPAIAIPMKPEHFLDKGPRWE